VDGTPIRELKNNEARGVAFPKSQPKPMRLYASLWNADDWATQGDRVKAALPGLHRRRLRLGQRQAAVPRLHHGAGAAGRRSCWWWNQQLSDMSYRRMRWVQRKFMIYNYCTDAKRFPQGVPAECHLR